MSLEEALPTFVHETRELLQDIESKLLRGTEAAKDPEALNAIFRAAHTIKGTAGLFQLDHIVDFTHGMESVLEAMRDGRVGLDEELATLLLACADHISSMIDLVAQGTLAPSEDNLRVGQPLQHGLSKYLDSPLRQNAPADLWHISLRFGPDVLRNGMDPLSFIRYLTQLGSIAGIITLSDALPPAAQMDPETCYLGMEIVFRSAVDKASIENVFEFVRDDCQIRILPPHSRITEYIGLVEDMPQEAPRLGELLVRCGVLTASELEAAQAVQSASQPQQKLGAAPMTDGSVQPAVSDAALVKQKPVAEGRSLESRSIRVDADKLDKLIDLVGELIIATVATDLVARRTRALELQERTAALSTLVDEIRESALQLRMVKIRGTFARFQRVVHDVSRELGKPSGLQVSGEDTELDKTVVERLADPLTHLIRNAIDHGIESTSERLARGKPAAGTIKLDAYHDSGHVVIKVSDDGGGLQRDKILAKAIEQGLIESDRALSDDEVFALVFEPGLSTAEQVTNLSGRGVGMDVVKRNITALRGSVKIASEPGIGTTVTVRLPLTLAIIDGFLVGVGKSVFVLPLETIEECVEYPAQTVKDYLNLRGEVLPFIRLRELFQVEDPPAQFENVVVINHAGHKAGVVVDNLFGEFQTVIKPLGKLFGSVKWISGSSLLGTGEVALILDVPALVEQAS